METDRKYMLDSASKIRLLQNLARAWDGQWYIKTAEQFGTDQATALNETVGKSIQRIVARMSLKAWKKEKAVDFEDAGRMIRGLFDWSQGHFWVAKFEIAKESIHIEVARCPFYEGAKQAKLERTDQACVNCTDAWSNWMDTLLPGQKTNVTHLSKMSEGSTTCLIHLQKA